MNLDIKQIIQRVLETLRDDPTLGGYVKKFSCGNMNHSRKLFPFVEVGEISYWFGGESEAGAMMSISIEILAGTQSLVPGLAYDGNGADRKGILELCQDIAGVIEGSTFGGMFAKPVEDIKVNTTRDEDSSDFLKLATISFTAHKRVWFDD